MFAGQLRVANLVDTQGTTLLRTSEQSIQRIYSVSFDMYLVLFNIKVNFSCTRKGLVNQWDLWLNVCVNFVCLSYRDTQ